TRLSSKLYLQLIMIITHAYQSLQYFFFFSSRRRHTISKRDWSSDVCSSDLMPFDYTSAMSKEDAAAQAQTMGVAYEEIPIRAPFDGFMGLLAEEFADGNLGTTEENLQARCRGVILMALSNKHGQVVLACSNKSECAVGYSTLYGDMVGGFSVLK